MSLSAERLGTIIQREIVAIVNTHITSLKVGNISITEVRVTNDLSYANIFFAILSEDEEVIIQTLSLLEENRIIIRKDLAKKIKNTRKIPELVFKYDKTLSYGNKIDQVLNTL